MRGNRLWLLASVAAIAAIVIVGWLLGINPRFAETATAINERATVELLNATQATEIAALREQREDLETLEGSLDDLRVSIPDSSRTDAFTESVSATAAALGLQLKKLSFTEPGAWGVAASPTGAPAPQENSGTVAPPVPTAPDGVYTIAVSMELVGEIAPFVVAVQQLQEGQRLFVVTDVTYDADSDQTGTITGYLFVIRDPGSAPPSAGDTPAVDTPTPTPTPTP